LQAKKDVRKLFVNCCRLFPEACLALIRGAFSTLQQPLSQSTFSLLARPVLRLHVTPAHQSVGVFGDQIAV
jgi:hypothetical protein